MNHYFRYVYLVFTLFIVNASLIVFSHNYAAASQFVSGADNRTYAVMEEVFPSTGKVFYSGRELFVPLVVQSEYWQTFVEIANGSDRPQTYFVQGFNHDGRQVPDPGDESLVKGGKKIDVSPDSAVVFGLDELFDLPFLSKVTAIRIYSDEDHGPNALNTVSIGYRPVGGGENVLLSVPVTDPHQRVFVERFIQEDIVVTAWQPFVVAANISPFPMDIWINIQGDDEVLSAQVAQNLAPYAQIMLHPQDDFLTEIVDMTSKGFSGAELTAYIAGTMDPLAGLSASLILLGKGSEGEDVLAGWMLRGDSLKGDASGTALRRGTLNEIGNEWFLPLLIAHEEGFWSRLGYFNGDAADHILWLDHHLPDGNLVQTLQLNAPAFQTSEWNLQDAGMDLSKGGMVRVRVQDLTLGGSAYWMFGYNEHDSAQPRVLTAAQAPTWMDASTRLLLTGVSTHEEETILNLINPGSAPITCTIVLMDLQGQPSGQKSIEMAGRASTVLTLPAEKAPFQGLIEITADQPVMGMTTRIASDISGTRLHASSALFLSGEEEAAPEQEYTVTITVHDHFSGKPVSGVYYASPYGVQGPTDESGHVTFILNSTQMRFFSLFTRPDSSIDYMTRQLDWSQFVPENDHYTLNLTLARKDQPLPEVVAARLMPHGSIEEFDLLTEPVDFMRHKKNTARLVLDVNNPGWNITGYRIQQGDKAIFSSSADFSLLTPGMQFVANRPVFAIIETDLRTFAVPLGLRIRDNPDWPDPMNTLPSTEAFQVGDQVPFFDKSTVGIEILPVSVNLVYEDNKLILFFGLKDGFEDGKLVTPSKVISDMKEAGKNYTQALRKLQEWGVRPQPMQNTTTWNAEVSAMGFVKFSKDEHGDFEVIDGGGYIFGSGSLTHTRPFVVVIVPCFISGTVGAEVKAEFEYHSAMRKMEELFSNIIFTFTPNLELEGGVGMKGVASVSIAGKGDIPIEYRPVSDLFKVDLHLGAEFRIVVNSFLHYEKVIAEDTWQLYSNHTANPQALTLEKNQSADIFDMAAYKPSVRSTDIPQWLGYEDAPPRLGPVKEQVVIRNVLDGTEPRLLRFGNREILLWIDDDPQRDAANRSALMYMVRWVGGKFDERPRHVLDQGTSDVSFHAVVHKGQLFVAWQNINKKIELSDSMLEEMCRHSQVHVARYIPGWGFRDHVTSLPEMYESNPRLASDGEHLGLFYLRNSDYNYFRNTGLNEIVASVYDGWGWRNSEVVMQATEHAVVAYAAAMDGSTPVAAVVIDSDGDLRTIDDRVLKLYRSGISRDVVAKPDITGHPVFAGHQNTAALFWFQDHDIYYQKDIFQGKARTERVFGKHVEAITDEYDLMLDADGQVRAILWTDSDMQLNAEAVASFYIDRGDHGQWGQPVPLTKSGRRVEAPQGFMADDGSAVLTYRVLSFDISSQQYRRSNSDLVVADVTPSIDLALAENAILMHFAPQQPGTDHHFDFIVSNFGTVLCNGLILEVMNVRGEVVNTMTFSDLLLPGESIILTGKYPVPDPLVKHNFSIRVKPLNGKDIGLSSKTASTTVGIADVRIVKASIWRPEPNTRHTRVRVRNMNYVRIPEAVVVVTENDRVIKKSDPFSLEPLQAHNYEFVENVDESSDPTYNHRRSYALEIQGVDALDTVIYHSVSINPFRLTALTPSIHGASGQDGSIKVDIAVKNNHPVKRSGELLVELLDDQEKVVDSVRQVVSQQSNSAELITKYFSINGRADGYSVRVSIPRDTLGYDPGPVYSGPSLLAPDMDIARVVLDGAEIHNRASRIMDWAESILPDLFPEQGRIVIHEDKVYYRYYPDAGVYLAGYEGQLLYYNPSEHQEIIHLGTIDELLMHAASAGF
ncbi:hypothetical protein [Desulfonatronovibrio magnus]|uniref:hypothetical protein n=1 Tax=Desulfonatronovibrio magnus TaxID=698827 RepID=UPI0005EB34B5|nr:hypothetical protein [Desulfonatronovibrio magnus]